MTAQTTEGGGPVVARTGGHRSWTSGRGGPVYPWEPPGSSSLTGEGQRTIGVNESLMEEEAAGAEVAPGVLGVGSSSTVLLHL
jgi:hypothetical protein